jgi:hypothetical protein
MITLLWNRRRARRDWPYFFAAACKRIAERLLDSALAGNRSVASQTNLAEAALAEASQKSGTSGYLGHAAMAPSRNNSRLPHLDRFLVWSCVGGVSAQEA